MRKWLIIPMFLLIVALVSTTMPTSLAAPHRQDLPETLPNGVAAGDATQTSAVLWTHSTALGEVVFEYGADASFAEVMGSATAEVTDPLQPVKVAIEGLSPNTQYYYRVTDAAGNTASGTFRTPAEMGARQGLRFGVTGDWRGELSPYPSILNVAERDLDFFVLHGDTIYADYASPDLPLEQALTLEDYRIKHNEVYGTRYGLNAFSMVRSSTNIYAMIDDHEVSNDFAGGAPPSYDERFADYEGEFVNDTEIFNNGLQAFHEYNPINEEFYGDTGDTRTANKRKLYRYRTFGSDAAIFLIDSRSFRDAPLEPVVDITDQSAVISFLRNSYDDTRTMLGRPQMDMLKADLLAAHEAGILWKFVFIPEPIQNFGAFNAFDRFEGYAAERTELLSFIVENGITNVVFVAADFHGTLVNDLTYQNGLRDILSGTHNPTDTFEVVTGAVAFDEPFGPTVVRLAFQNGLITQEQYDQYLASDKAGRDAFMEALLNAQVEPYGYSLVGLDDAEHLDVELVQGAYLGTSFFGWTEFEINAETGALHVITYGIDAYNQAEMEADPEAIISRTPVIISEFIVQPK